MEGFTDPHDGDVTLTIEMFVPSSQVGRIIGKGGANVRELQRLTGAIIKLPEQLSPPPKDETSVVIIGKWIQALVRYLDLWPLKKPLKIFNFSDGSTTASCNARPVVVEFQFGHQVSCQWYVPFKLWQHCSSSGSIGTASISISGRSGY